MARQTDRERARFPSLVLMPSLQRIQIRVLWGLRLAPGLLVFTAALIAPPPAAPGWLARSAGVDLGGGRDFPSTSWCCLANKMAAVCWPVGLGAHRTGLCFAVSVCTAVWRLSTLRAMERGFNLPERGFPVRSRCADNHYCFSCTWSVAQGERVFMSPTA